MGLPLFLIIALKGQGERFQGFFSGRPRLPLGTLSVSTKKKDSSSVIVLGSSWRSNKGENQTKLSIVESLHSLRGNTEEKEQGKIRKQITEHANAFGQTIHAAGGRLIRDPEGIYVDPRNAVNNPTFLRQRKKISRRWIETEKKGERERSG